MSEPFKVEAICRSAEAYFQRDKFLSIVIDSDSSDEDSEDSTNSETSDEDSESDGNTSDYDSDDDQRKKKKKKHSDKKKKTSKKTRSRHHSSAPVPESDVEYPSTQHSAHERRQRQAEVEELIQQLNSMSISNPAYGLLYFKALKLDKSITDCVKSPLQEPFPQPTNAYYSQSPQVPSMITPPAAPMQPVQMAMPAPAQMGDRSCFGCGELGHPIRFCQAIQELLQNKVIIRNMNTNQLTLPDGSRIPRYMGEPMVQTLKRLGSQRLVNPKSFQAALVTVGEPQTDYWTLDEDEGQYANVSYYPSYWGGMVDNGYIEYPSEPDAEEEPSHEEEEDTDSMPELQSISDSSSDESTDTDNDGVYAVRVMNGFNRPPYEAQKAQLQWAMPAERATKEITRNRRQVIDHILMPPVPGTSQRRDKRPVKPAPPPQEPQLVTPSKPAVQTLPSQPRPAQNVPQTRAKTQDQVRYQQPQPEVQPVPQPRPFDARPVRRPQFAPTQPEPVIRDVPMRDPPAERIHQPKHATKKPYEPLPVSSAPKPPPISKDHPDAPVAPKPGPESELMEKILNLEVPLRLHQLFGTSRDLRTQMTNALKLRRRKASQDVVLPVAGTVMPVPQDEEPFQSRSSKQGPLIKLSLVINGVTVRAIIDTGAQRKYEDGITRTTLYVSDMMPFDLLLGRPWQKDNLVSISERENGTFLEFRKGKTVYKLFVEEAYPGNNTTKWVTSSSITEINPADTAETLAINTGESTPVVATSSINCLYQTNDPPSPNEASSSTHDTRDTEDTDIT
ncbi:hypothetical protein HGRIS_012012 [Hohenbuehelia grisea]|uniref:CCHC-type domain-containing protein n=1 Tax=Hohenbuehelia grisea TaxID=104357 RepID=A0ABR3IP29_9AGAR